MLDLMRRLVWFFVVSASLSYAVFLVGGSAIQKQVLADLRTLLVRDYLKVGEHHLSGMVMVPSTCSQLSVETAQVTETVFHLKFTTWEEPYVACVHEETPRAFRTVVFAPSVGVHFIATLDESPLPVSVIVANRHPAP